MTLLFVFRIVDQWITVKDQEYSQYLQLLSQVTDRYREYTQLLARMSTHIELQLQRCHESRINTLNIHLNKKKVKENSAIHYDLSMSRIEPQDKTIPLTELFPKNRYLP